MLLHAKIEHGRTQLRLEHSVLEHCVPRTLRSSNTRVLEHCVLEQPNTLEHAFCSNLDIYIYIYIYYPRDGGRQR